MGFINLQSSCVTKFSLEKFHDGTDWDSGIGDVKRLQIFHLEQKWDTFFGDI